MKDLKELSGNEMKFTAEPKKTPNDSDCFCPDKECGWHGNLNDCTTLDYDPTDGYHLRGCPVCEEEVKYTQTEDYYEYHPKVDRNDDDFTSGLENERQEL